MSARSRTDDHILWIGSYTADLGGTGVGVLRIVVKPAAAMIIDSSRFRCDSPSFVAATPCGDVSYAVEEQTGLLRTFQLDPNGELECADALFVGRQPCHIAVDPAGRFLVVSDWRDGDVTFVRLQENGVPRRGGVAQMPAVDQGARAHAALILDDAMIITTDPGLDRLRIWSFDVTGQPWESGGLDLPTGSQPRHLTRDAKGRIHVLTEGSSEVLTLERVGPHDLALIASSSVRTQSGSQDLPSSLSTMTIDGDTVLHAAVRGSNVLATLRSDERGALITIDETATGGDEPRDHCLLDNWLYVANRRTDTVEVFELKNGIPSHAFAIPIDAPASVSAHLGPPRSPSQLSG
ncbi:hypothetical protein ASF88_19335 [Leifsonia sp. Leaf336]|uniref:lactonase family protein n=1 Tax=Leifsonia sp. Leaf336 TaxID=1736341 RepID=UPI0006FEDB75|nr:beta-propeller fold lactonase family protein [Leifsonia sp. Leaf336]KQR51318.1 hypothetical protein ASF88_19335 [Leifsonia sp. Leaf336]